MKVSGEIAGMTFRFKMSTFCIVTGGKGHLSVSNCEYCGRNKRTRAYFCHGNASKNTTGTGKIEMRAIGGGDLVTLTESREVTAQNALRPLANRHGITFDMSTIEGARQTLHRLNFLIVQYWDSFSDQEKEQLYTVAKRAVRGHHDFKFDWSFVKNLPKTFGLFKDMFHKAKTEGLYATNDRLQDTAKMYNQLYDTVVALYEKGNLVGVVPEDERAIHAAAAKLRDLGLHYVVVERKEKDQFELRCFVDPEVEYEYEPTHRMSVDLMKAANDTGTYIYAIDFVPNYAESAGAH